MPEDSQVELNYNVGPNAKDVSKSQDGKLFKEIITEGEGDEMPFSGAEIFVNYVGTLTDGTEFDRNRAGQPFSFMFGKESVIKGWEQGVATMRKGEKAKLICHPDYAYGSSEAGKIPANSTLIFEIELLYWKDEDLTTRKSGGITRKKIVEGTSKYLSPNDGANVTVALKGSFNGKVFDEREVIFPLGEGAVHNIPYGLEKALYKFSEKEKSLIKLQSRYAFGEAGNEALGVSPNSDVEYEVELKTFEKAKENWQLEGKEKLEMSRGFKEKGTNYFKSEKYLLAAKQYKRIVDFLKTEAMLDGDEETERKILLAVGYLNQAICYIKLNDHVQALRCADEALVLEPDNVKGLYRRGLANIGINEPNGAKADFLKVLALDPTNKAAVQQIAVCDRLIKEHKQKEKQIYSKMFDKFAKIDKARDMAEWKRQINGLDNLDEWEKSESNTNKTNGASENTSS